MIAEDNRNDRKANSSELQTDKLMFNRLPEDDAYEGCLDEEKQKPTLLWSSGDGRYEEGTYGENQENRA